MPKTEGEAPKTRARKKTTTTRSRTTTGAAKKVARKAPTRKSIVTVKHATSGKMVLFSVIAFFAIFGVSYAIGTTDTGVINVSAVINQRAAILEAKGDFTGSQIARDASASAKTKTAAPNGGLVGRGNKVTEQQKNEKKKAKPASTASSTASSTSQTASSTDPVSEDVPSGEEEDVRDEDTSRESSDDEVVTEETVDATASHTSDDDVPEEDSVPPPSRGL